MPGSVYHEGSNGTVPGATGCSSILPVDGVPVPGSQTMMVGTLNFTGATELQGPHSSDVGIIVNPNGYWLLKRLGHVRS